MDPRLPPLPAAQTSPARSPAPAAPGFGAKAVESVQRTRGPGVPEVEPIQTRAPAAPAPRLTADVRIEVDKAAGRMVQTFVDPATGEELKQFPYDSQLAFSRALGAFERARFDKS
jgi:hypothetical protein